MQEMKETWVWSLGQEWRATHSSTLTWSQRLHHFPPTVLIPSGWFPGWWSWTPAPFFGIGMKTDLCQSCDHCWISQVCWHNECSTLTTSSFRILNSSAGIPSPPLALFVVMLPMQSTSCEMPGYMKHKIESRLLGEISITPDIQVTPPLWQKAKRN